MAVESVDSMQMEEYACRRQFVWCSVGGEQACVGFRLSTRLYWSLMLSGGLSVRF